jgi:hypothetical protein
VAPQIGFLSENLDPYRASFKAGGLAIVDLPLIAAVVNPYVVVPLNHTSDRHTVVRIPVWVYLPLPIYILSGLNDKSLQLALGANLSLLDTISVGAEIGWPRIAGDGHDAKNAVGTLYGQLRF